jgi:hypothetical protein
MSRDDVLLRTLAFAFVDDHTGHLDHVHPVHFKGFWISHKHLITVLDGVTEQFEYALVQFIQFGPLLQLFFDDFYFVICGLVCELYVKWSFVVLIYLRAELRNDV